MSQYIEILKTRGVTRIVTAQLTARFPFGMLSLALLLHIESIHHSYALAGLVLAFASIGQAIAGPLTSRFMGIWGMRPVLWITVVICFSAISAIGLFPLPLEAAFVVAFVAGLSMPPIQPAVRTVYPKMVPSTKLAGLFALDASTQELIWMAGPVLITLVSTQISTVAGILMTSSILLFGSMWFISCKEVGEVRIPRSKKRFGSVLRTPAVALTTGIGFLLIGSCAAVEVGVVALYGEGSALSGLVLASWALVSLAGGLTLGHLPIGPTASAWRMFIVFIGLLVSLLLFDFWWGLLLGLFISGFGVAPALAACFAIVSSSVKFSSTAEAFGWVGSGQLIGAAIGSACAGFAIDKIGAEGAFYVSAAFAFVGFMFPLLARKIHPDLRGKDLSPHPDTAPITLTDTP